jgi:hypothetical protein
MLRFHRSALGVAPLLALAAACSAGPDSSFTPANKEAEGLSTVRPMAAPVLPKLQGNWIDLGGGLVTDAVITALPNIYYNVMATGPDGNIYSAFNDGIGNPWGGWTSLGNAGTPIKAPPAVVVYGNYIDVFAFDPTLGLISKHGTLNGPSAPTFTTTWLNQSASGMPANNGKPPVVVLSQPGNQENIFATMSDGSIAVMRTGMSLLGNWQSLSGVFNTTVAPAAVSWGPNRIDVFGLSGGAIFHRFSADNGNTFSGNGTWELVGGGGVGVSTPAVVSWGSGRFDLFELTSNGTAEHIAANATAWETWCGAAHCWDQVGGNAWTDSLHGSATPVAVATGVGAVNLFFQGANHELFEAAMSTPETATTGPKWTTEDNLASCFRTGGTPSVISANGTNIEIAVTAYGPSGDTNVWVNSTSIDDVGTPNANNIPACTCGAPGGPCCDKSACNAFATCTTATQECVSCGQLTQQQCFPGTPCVPWTQPDANGNCQACGANGETACSSGTACQTSGYSANSQGLCEPTPCVLQALSGSYKASNVYDPAFNETDVEITGTLTGNGCTEIDGPIVLGLTRITVPNVSLPFQTIAPSIPAKGITFKARYSQGEIIAGTYYVYAGAPGVANFALPPNLTVNN